MAQLQEQLVGMRARTASIDSPVSMADADSAAADSPSSPSQQGSNLSSASHMAMQGTPPQEPPYLGSAPARLAAEPGLEAETQSAAQLSARSMRSAARRPRSIAQKAGMNAWSRHSHRNGCVTSVHKLSPPSTLACHTPCMRDSWQTVCPHLSCLFLFIHQRGPELWMEDRLGHQETSWKCLERA